MAEEENTEPSVEEGFELRAIAEITTVLERLMMMQEVVLELVKITGERVDAIERYQKGLSFEDMVDGKVPPAGITDEQRHRLLELQERLAERLPDLPSGF